MNTKVHRPLRRQMTARLSGVVLEIGFGSGLNLPFYPTQVDRILAVDPAVVGRQIARRRLADCPIPVEFRELRGKQMALETDSVDMVLSTWNLCTISDVQTALAEILRVLKPGGEFHFLEHGLSPDRGVAKWQRRLNPVTTHIAGGCQLVRQIDQEIRQAGFRIEGLRNYYVKGPKAMTYHYEGVALPAR